MPPTRIRVQTLPPNLPALRVWVVPTSSSSPSCPSKSSYEDPIQGDYNPPKTILDLKCSICSQIPLLKESKIKPDEISLFLDEFELMDGSAFGGVVRDGDLVVVRRNNLGVGKSQRKEKEEPETRGTKRKRSSSVPRSEFVKDKKAGKGKKEREEDGEDDESSSSSGSSSSSSSGSSSSSSSGSSSSSSSTTTTSGSSSTSSSTSSASSSSSADDDSDTDTDTDEDEPPVPQKTRKLAATSGKTKVKEWSRTQGTVKPKVKDVPSVLHVPPGLGKPSTHSRNERRKRKRAAERAVTASSAQAPPNVVGSSSANAVPLGSGSGAGSRGVSASGKGDDAKGSGKRRGDSPQPEEEEEGEGESEVGEEMDVDRGSMSAVDVNPPPSTNNDWAGGVMMASLRNKNKKKGFFRQAMMRGLSVPEGAGKIVFDGIGGEGISSPGPSTSASVVSTSTIQQRKNAAEKRAEGTASPTKAKPRLIPPSELQEKGLLPRNVVVTSVDVEEGMWDRSNYYQDQEQQAGGDKRSRKQKNKGKGKNKIVDAEYEEDYYGYEDPDQFVDAEEEAVKLVYDDGVDGYEEGKQTKKSAVDWEKAEIGWNNYPILEERGQAVVGGVVGWKGLSLNPSTLTPEIMLSLARVLSISDDTVKVRHLVRSVDGENEVAAAFGIGRGDGEEEGEEEDVNWEAIWALGDEDKWRVVAQ
ncbi:hypothetical protein H1R20_g15649, partial [Candolleomyces eurysporus]